MPREHPDYYTELTDDDYLELEALDREFEANREADRIAEAVFGLPETKFGLVPDSVVPIFEFDEAQRAFQRMMYYSRFQEVM